MIGSWALLVAVLAVCAELMGTPTDDDMTLLPGTDAQLVRDLTMTTAPPTTGMVILRSSTERLDGTALAPSLKATSASLRLNPHVAGVVPPSTAEGTLSPDGRTGWFTITLDVDRAQVTAPLARAVMNSARPAADAGVEVVPGGSLAQAVDGSGAHRQEIIGLAFAAVVLTVTLGSLLGAAIPLLTSLLALMATLEIVGLAGNVTSIPSVAITLATMVGLGVGIDYSLFLLSRFRELTKIGVPTQEAIGLAVGGTGTAVTFAGVTVAVALAGLGLAHVPILQTLAWTSMLAVAFAVLAAVTLLPALTSLVGERVARGGLVRTRRAAASRRRPRHAAESTTYWARQAERVTRRPWLFGGGALVLLALLTAPAKDLHLGQLDAGSSPSVTAVRHANDIVTAAFGPGRSAPLTVVARPAEPIASLGDPRVSGFVAQVKAQPNVASVGPPWLTPAGGAVAVTAFPGTAGSDPATAELVRHLRRSVLPGMTVHVGGITSARVDLGERVASRLPIVITVVLSLSVVVLMAAFRAPFMALKAAFMDLISIGAAYGALTVIFTWGWGATWLGLSGPVPIPSFVPLMLFALLFGLSMDYEVFLLSAVQRHWVVTNDSVSSVREGLSSTGRVITAAATIMAGVFLAFVPNNDPTVKMFGVGMAVAIAVDASVVRGLLVPATLALLADLTWYTPRAWRFRQDDEARESTERRDRARLRARTSEDSRRSGRGGRSMSG